MANATNYLEQMVINHIFRAATFAKPNPAIALTLDIPTDSSFTEVSNVGTGYARYAIVSGDARWDAPAAAGTTQNAVEFTFDACAGVDWGTVSGVVITDNAGYGLGSGLLYGTLTTPKLVQVGDTFKFAIGASIFRSSDLWLKK